MPSSGHTGNILKSELCENIIDILFWFVSHILFYPLDFDFDLIKFYDYFPVINILVLLILILLFI
jgi:hypothetical protein